MIAAPARWRLLAAVVLLLAVTACSAGGAVRDGASGPADTTTDGSGAVVPAGSGPVPPRTPVARTTPRPPTSALLAGLRLVNYQPSTDAWPGLWTNWRPGLLDRDLAAVAALGGTTVRVSVIPDALGWPVPRPAMTARLAQYVDLAAAHGLTVQLTLFDWFGRLDETTSARAWAAAVAAPFRGDSRVAFAEVLNEVDPGDPRTLAFLRAVLPAVRTALPGVPVTVSVSSTAGPDALRRLVTALPGLLDVADIHFYGEATQAAQWLERAKAAAGGLPLLVGEAGHSLRYPVDPDRDVAHHEALQAVWFDAVLRAGRDVGVPVGVWMLGDLASGAVPGHSESEEPQEYRFGLRRLDGTLRPAAGVVRAWWAGRPPSGLVDTFSRTGTDGLPPGWRVDRPDAAGYALDPATGAGEPGSARISAASADPLAVPDLFRVVPVDVRPGARIRATARVRVDGGGAVTVALGWHDADGAYTGGVESPRAPRGPGWSTLSVTGTAPPGARTVFVYLKASGVAGAAWFDDVAVRPL